MSFKSVCGLCMPLVLGGTLSSLSISCPTFSFRSVYGPSMPLLIRGSSFPLLFTHVVCSTDSQNFKLCNMVCSTPLSGKSSVRLATLLLQTLSLLISHVQWVEFARLPQNLNEHLLVL